MAAIIQTDRQTIRIEGCARITVGEIVSDGETGYMRKISLYISADQNAQPVLEAVLQATDREKLKVEYPASDF